MTPNRKQQLNPLISRNKPAIGASRRMDAISRCSVLRDHRSAPSYASRRRLLRTVAGVVAVSTLMACSPAARFDQAASHLELEREVQKGNGFDHVVYSRVSKASSKVDGRSPVLHVYLGGDGTPWASRSRVALDPTPRRPLGLRLMALDPAPALYLGRPCYHGLADTPPCSPALWTDFRYSEAVVASMTHALTSILAEADSPKVVLFGYSGGGALAMLIAERVEQTTAVVTIAANLDPDAWTAHHGFTPLRGSLKPVERAPLPARVAQLHYLGAKDSVVPPHLFADSMASSPGTEVIVVANFTHVCCWVELWPEVLDHVDARVWGPQK